ncbi:MAG: putative ABC-type transport system, ATPase component [Chloroflexi bacterium]|jgi:ABC-type lipoprotein export system ATPase subunit|nr:putative ABC-type transport system, ATPase component [Chloroflexota bacterium]
MTAAVRIRDLRYRYRGTDRDVLRMATLDVDGPGLLAVVGKTGAGKTTLMELLAGTLREPYHGSMQVLGVELRDLRRDADRQRHLRRVGLIPQDFGLLPGSTVRDILLQDLADAQVPVSEHEERVRHALNRVGILSFAGRNSEQLSGGQRQRAAIARTLARDVDLMIADEPTANLDPAQAESIMALFEELGASCPVIIVTHNMAVAARCARTLVLHPLVEHSPSSAWRAVQGVETAVRQRRGVATVGAMLLLTLATAGSTLAVQATNAHHTSRRGAVAERSTAGVPRSVAQPPARTAAPAPAPEPSAARLPASAVEVMQLVNRTLPGTPPPVRPPAPGGALPSPSPGPTASSGPPVAPYFMIRGRRYPVCPGRICGGTFVHDSDWAPGVPSYYDYDGSIIGNQHGFAAGVEVDFWNGAALTRYQVLASTTVANSGRPGHTAPPAGTAMELGGVDQANVCTGSTCPAPYYYTYVFLTPAG